MIDETAADMIARIENHVGKKIDDRRLKSALKSQMQRLINSRNGLENRILNVISGDGTYDIKNQKVITKPAREK